MTDLKDLTEWQKFLNNPSAMEQWTEFHRQNDPGFSAAWDYATTMNVTGDHRTLFAYAFAFMYRTQMETERCKGSEEESKSATFKSQQMKKWNEAAFLRKINLPDSIDAEVGVCQLCGKPMPKGEEMFKFHGYSGDCPAE